MVLRTYLRLKPEKKSTLNPLHYGVFSFHQLINCYYPISQACKNANENMPKCIIESRSRGKAVLNLNKWDGRLALLHFFFLFISRCAATRMTRYDATRSYLRSRLLFDGIFFQSTFTFRLRRGGVYLERRFGRKDQRSQRANPVKER